MGVSAKWPRDFSKPASLLQLRHYGEQDRGVLWGQGENDGDL